MPPKSDSEQAPQGEQATACYIYGVVPADVESSSDAHGVGDPPGQISVVRHGEIAALVSEVRIGGPLGTAEDLTAHQRLLDSVVTEVPVLPIRFGAVVTNADAVREEFLAPPHDEFLAALKELEGRAEYVVKGRYVEEAVLSEVLSEVPEAQDLRDQLRGQPEDATRNIRIQLGEIINEAVTAKRQKDTQALLDAMADKCVTSAVREPSHELDAANVAFLMDTSREKDIEQVIDDLADNWDGRVELRLLGPMAAYDFVGNIEPEG